MQNKANASKTKNDEVYEINSYENIKNDISKVLKSHIETPREANKKIHNSIYEIIAEK